MGVAPPRSLLRAKARPFRPSEIGIAVALPVVADVALWSRGEFSAGGVGIALLFTLLPAILFLGARSWRPSARLGVLVGLLVLVVVRSVFDPTPASVLSGAGLVIAFGLALRRRQIFVPDALLAAVAVVTALPRRVAAAFAGGRKITARTRLGEVSVLPVVVPVGLVSVFAAVFALANPVVAHGFAIAWRAVSTNITFPSVGRVLFWIIALVAGTALVRPACRLVKRTETRTPQGEATTTSLLVARNALVGLNALFLVEMAIDAKYLWSGSPPPGMDTQRYAHEGAFWLTLALVMLTAVVGVMFRGPLADDPRANAKRTRVLAQVWMAQGLVLAAGTYRRIAIHVARSGLSDLRIVGILGTTLVVVGVVLVGLKLREKKTFGWLLRRQLDGFALTLVLYAVVPTHLLSARMNVARIESGEIRPTLHLFRQSHKTESAAALVPLLDHPDRRIREGVAALLIQERARLREESDRQTSWNAHDLATSRTLAALDQASKRMDEVSATAKESDPIRDLLEMSHVANGERSDE